MIFSDYFNEWLYGNDGYYSTLKPIGKHGDFYTSVSTSQFFGGSIANYIIKRIDEGAISPYSLILEIGAHKGFLLKDIVTFIYTMRPALLTSLKFGVVERFDQVANELQKFIDEHIGDSISFTRYESLCDLKNEPCGFVYANEIFDAFSCELLYESKFARVDNGVITFDVSNKQLLEECNKLGIQKGEISIGFEEFSSSMSNAFERVEFLSFDYGQEYPRNDFSIRIYKNHQTYPLFGVDNMSEFFKNSDITLDVNFDHLTKAFVSNGFTRLFYKAQMSALIYFGIDKLLEILAKEAGQKAYEYELSKVKLLLSPAHFGERFKAISFTKGIE